METQKINLYVELLQFSNLFTGDKARFKFEMYRKSPIDEYQILIPNYKEVSIGGQQSLEEIGKTLIIELNLLKEKSEQNTFVAVRPQKTYEHAYVFVFRNRFLIQMNTMENETCYQIVITELI